MSLVSVLMIDHDVTDRKVIIDVVKTAYLCDSVVVVENLRAACDTLSKQTFNLILLNGVRPVEEDALVLFEAARHVPVGVLLMEGQGRLAAYWLTLGAADYLLKDSASTYLTLLPHMLRRILKYYRMENSLHQAQFERSLAGVFRATLDGRLLNCNDRLAHILGYESREDALQRQTWQMHFDPANMPNFIQYLMQNGHLTNYEWHLRRTEGTLVNILCNIAIIEDESGERLIAGSMLEASRQYPVPTLMHSSSGSGGSSLFAEPVLRLQVITEALLDVVSTLTRTLDLNEVLDNILVQLGRVVDYDAISVMLLHDGIAEVVRYRGYGDYGVVSEFDVSDSPELQKVLMERKPIITPDTDYLYHWVKHSRVDWVRSNIMVPIILENTVIGLLNLDSAEPNSFSIEQAGYLQAFAHHAAIAIHNARLFDALKDSHDRLRRLAQQVVQVQEEERRRLSRELHDEAGQALTALKIMLVTMRSGLPEDSHLHDQLQQTATLTEQTMNQLRTLAHNLRPPALDSIGLLPTAQHYCERFADSTGLDITFNSQPLPDLNETVNISLYRLLQEALTNVVKHAQATQVGVTLRHERALIVLAVCDNGVGFANGDHENRPGVGLLGMRERLQLVGGWLDIQSQPHGGTRITAYVPIEDNHNDKNRNR
jgi:PAS domain S-box-containing protein